MRRKIGFALLTIGSIGLFIPVIGYIAEIPPLGKLIVLSCVIAFIGILLIDD